MIRLVSKIEPTKHVTNLIAFAELVVKEAMARGLVQWPKRKYRKRKKRAKKSLATAPAPTPKKAKKKKVKGNKLAKHPLAETTQTPPPSEGDEAVEGLE